MKTIASEELPENMRHDSLPDFFARVTEVFRKVEEELEKKTSVFGLWEKIEKISNATRKLTIKEWKRAVKHTLAVDISNDYYSGEFYQNEMENWVHDNVSLIKTIPQQALGEMKEIVLEGYQNGKTNTAVMKEIQKTYKTSKSRATFIARDQLSKLNADITMHQQKDAGVDKYIWRTVKDKRVRDRHKDLEGKTFAYDDPPIVDTKTGRRAHPGKDFRCRCYPEPIFEFDTLTLPVQDKL